MTSLLKKGLRLASGFGLLIVGAALALPGVPGPGIPLILLGLWILSGHFVWARKILAWAKQKFATLAARVHDREQTVRGGQPRASSELKR
jgi:hypothetical protein